MFNTPTYCGLGKAAKDVFNKGYGFGKVKIDLRTKSYSGVEFSTSRHVYTDTEKASGNLETKCKVCDYGTHLHPKVEYRQYSGDRNLLGE